MSDTEQPKPEEKKSRRRIVGVIAAAVAAVSLGGYVALSSGFLNPASPAVKEAAAPVALASLMPAQTPDNADLATPTLQTNDVTPIGTADAGSAESAATTTDEDASGKDAASVPEPSDAVTAPAASLESHDATGSSTKTDAANVEPAVEDVPALAITNLEIEPIDALERGTYKVTGTLANPDSNKKIELTAIKGLLKDKTGATVEEVAFDLPSKRIMEPGGRQDFSYTVVAKEPGIVRLEVAVDLLR